MAGQWFPFAGTTVSFVSFVSFIFAINGEKGALFKQIRATERSFVPSMAQTAATLGQPADFRKAWNPASHLRKWALRSEFGRLATVRSPCVWTAANSL
jgi:hypothetical protein